jgi:hypothetical protein
VSLVRPAVRDLVFQLYSRPLHPELFEIMAVDRVKLNKYQAEVRLTRTGHVILWHWQDHYLTEVLTAADDALPERRLLSHRLRHEAQSTAARVPGVQYQASFQVEVLPPGLFRQVHEEILADGLRRGLLHHFAPHHRLSLTPLGLVTTEASPGCFVINTFHTFPEELTVVKSQSLIETKS